MRRRLASFLLLSVLAAGCGRSEGDPSDPTPTPTPTPGPGGDEAIFEAMLAGETPAAEGIAAVAASDGWPIATDTDYVFVRANDGQGPYSLAGDHDAWAGAPMALVNGFWWIRVEIASPVGSLYKFVDDLDVFAADPRSRRYGYDVLGEYSLVDASAAHLQRFFDVTDGMVEPRTVRVRVPAAPATHHLYVHDGQNLFDPNAINGGWKLDETLGASTLAIGIDNTSARMDEYTPVPDDIGSGAIGGDGNVYADFVHGHVRPMIELRFGAPDRVGTMGSSLGGLIAFHLVLRHPGYDFAASLSGTMGWGSINSAVNNQTMIEAAVADGHGTTTIYLDSGGDDGAGNLCLDSDSDGVNDDTADSSDNYCENRQLADALPGVGYVFDVDLFHWHEPNAAHNEAAWAARVFRPLGIFEAL